MIGRIPPPKIKVGDELTAAWLNAVRQAAVEGSIAELGPGLVGMPTPNGLSLSLASIAGSTLKPGLTTSVITARVATTPGKGPVDLYTLDPTPGTITADGESVTAYSISSTVGGIPSGTYVMVQRDSTGNWWVIAADCT